MKTQNPDSFTVSLGDQFDQLLEEVDHFDLTTDTPDETQKEECRRVAKALEPIYRGSFGDFKKEVFQLMCAVTAHLTYNDRLGYDEDTHCDYYDGEWERKELNFDYDDFDPSYSYDVYED